MSEGGSETEGETETETEAKAPWWPLALLFVTGLLPALFGYQYLRALKADASAVEQEGQYLLALALSYPLALAIAVLGLRWLRLRVWPRLVAAAEGHADALDALPERQVGAAILVASAAALFVELLLIRWHATTFEVFSFYKNFSLLAAFLGLGIGFGLGKRRPLLTVLALPALSLQFAVLHLLRYGDLSWILRNPVSERMSMGMFDMQGLGQTAVTYGFLILVFLFTVLTCVPLGHLASYLMQRRPPLVAYGWNLLGSLLGIGLLTLLSLMWSPPAVWLVVAAALVLPFLVRGRAAFLAGLVSVCVALVVVLDPVHINRIEVHSPYQPIVVDVRPGDQPLVLSTNNFFQEIRDLSPASQERDPELQKIARYYEFPYWVKPRPRRVLVVGAGTGNDVAAALRCGAGQIDAVEIDPAILALGRALHPERPYQSDRVRGIDDDARGHMRRARSDPGLRYDLVVYGLLDSHATLSALSSVRLDSFVYTVEGVRDARALLSDDGILAMTFCLMSKTQGKKFFEMLKVAFDGQEPRVFETRYLGGFTFLAGPGLSAALGSGRTVPLRETTEDLRTAAVEADLSTDDWPFLYMPRRTFPRSYVLFLVLLGVSSVLLLRPFLPARGAAPRALSPACFLLGAGFMLIETKGITELALCFGNTWHVVSAVIAAILVMAYVANLLVQKEKVPPLPVAYGLLIGSVLLGLAFSGSAPLSLPGKVLVTGLVTLPIFFSGFAFSAEIKRSGDVAAALSSNLLGAMLGGLLEYNAMQFGYASLYVVAALIYAGAAFFALRGGRAAAPSSS